MRALRGGACPHPRDSDPSPQPQGGRETEADGKAAGVSAEAEGTPSFSGLVSPWSPPYLQFCVSPGDSSAAARLCLQLPQRLWQPGAWHFPFMERMGWRPEDEQWALSLSSAGGVGRRRPRVSQINHSSPM